MEVLRVDQLPLPRAQALVYSPGTLTFFFLQGIFHKADSICFSDTCFDITEA